MIYPLLIIFALSILIAVGWVHLDERRQLARDQAVFHYSVTRPPKPPRAIARLLRRNRADLRRALNR